MKDVTHVSTFIFQGLFKDITFRSAALNTKDKNYFIFFTRTRLFTALDPTICIKKIRVLGQTKLGEEVGGVKRPPPPLLPTLFRVKHSVFVFSVLHHMPAYVF